MSTRINQRLSFGAASDTSRQNSRVIDRSPGGPITRGTGISFSGNTISDSGNGLALFPVGGTINVQGSASNNREYLVTTSAAGALGVVPALTTESAGALVTITGF